MDATIPMEMSTSICTPVGRGMMILHQYVVEGLLAVRVIQILFPNAHMRDALIIRMVVLAKTAIAQRVAFVKSIVVGKHADWLITRKSA